MEQPTSTDQNNNKNATLDTVELEEQIIDAFYGCEKSNKGIGVQAIRKHLATKFSVMIPPRSADFRQALFNLVAKRFLYQDRGLSHRMSLLKKFKFRKEEYESQKSKETQQKEKSSRTRKRKLSHEDDRENSPSPKKFLGFTVTGDPVDGSPTIQSTPMKPPTHVVNRRIFGRNRTNTNVE